MFFHLINNSLIKEESYDYLLSLCDSVSFLYVDYSKSKEFKSDIIATKYETIYNSLIKETIGQSWEMQGTIYTFALTDEIKNIIKEISLQGKIQLTESSQLENIELIKNNKTMYSICTHEGYEEIDEKFSEQVSQFCLKEISKTGTYKKLYEKISYLQLIDINQMDNHFTILRDLDNYVSEDWNRVIYAPPDIETTYKEYLLLVNKYLTNETVEDLKEFSSFKELFPAGYPSSFEEIHKFDYSNVFLKTYLYKQIMEEIDIASAVIYNILQIKV